MEEEADDLDPQLLLRAGWSAEELYWEELSEAALALPPNEALPYWREAARIAPEALPDGDARQATNLANLALAESLDGQAEIAAALLRDAKTLWQAAEPWVAGLAKERRARSSLYHHRLQSRYPGGYDHWSQARYRELFDQGTAALAARADGRLVRPDAFTAWREVRPPGLEDARRLIAAVYLIAPDPCAA
ncbi:MAG: hypothetical protein Kilf2KO_29590 [Rhodospirillales bacterium]